MLGTVFNPQGSGSGSGRCMLQGSDMDPRLEEILRLAQRGAKLEALRVLRSITGMSLEDADRALKKMQTPGTPGEWTEQLTSLLRQQVRPGEAPRAQPPGAQDSPPGAQNPPQRPAHGAMTHHMERLPTKPEERHHTPYSDTPRKHASKPRHSTLALGTPLVWILLAMLALAFFAMILVALLVSRYA